MASRDGRIVKLSNSMLTDDTCNNIDAIGDQPLADLHTPLGTLPSSTGCLVCGIDNDHANILLCEECNGEFHTYCLTPKLDTIPDADWFCDRCRPEAGDRLEERICALPRSYTSRFGDICWAQGGVGYGWWPAIIYDPRMTIGGARRLAAKHLGKRYLVYFFQCGDTPAFEVLPLNKIISWEQGLAEDCHLAKTAKATGRVRLGQFRKALQEASIEESLPKERRLDWNHQGGGGAEGAGAGHLPSPKKSARRKRRRVDNVNTAVTTKTSRKNVGATGSLSTSRVVVKVKTAHRNLSFSSAPTAQQIPPPKGPSASAIGMNQNDLSFKAKSAATSDSTSDKKLAASTTAASIASSSSRNDTGDGEMYCKVQREIHVKATTGRSNSSLAADSTTTASPVLLDVGFVRLESRTNATFTDVRRAIEEELAADALPPKWEWRFRVPNLGPLSKKQESKFGPMLAFLKNAATSGGKKSRSDVGNGTLQSPVHVTLVDTLRAVAS